MSEDITKALEVLRNGGVILYPTDNTWALGCDATNPLAVDKILKIFKFTDNQSITILVDTANRLYSYVDNIPDIAIDLIEMSESPITLILEGAKLLATNAVNHQDNSVNISVVTDPFCKQLIQRFKKPIVAVPASLTEKDQSVNFLQIGDEIIEHADYTVTHRKNDQKPLKLGGIIKIGKNATVKVIRE